jgi:predicted aminopeptidase
MDVLKLIFTFVFILLFTTGCQLSYYFRSAYNHFSIMNSRVAIEKAIENPSLPEEHKQKLKLAMAAHEFAINHVGLNQTKNYTTYVDLGRAYVSWVVSAAHKWKLEHHLWSYPFIGKMPYKGFMSEAEANEEKNSLIAQNLDAEYRGVSAYSTLGWFQDSVLSSMLRSSEHQLVNTILHETTHTTIYIKNSADFNERLAVFVGNKASEEFYLAKEGVNSPTLKRIQEENLDDRIFSDFMSFELKELKTWYENLNKAEQNESARQTRFLQIQDRFTKNIKPLLKTKTYQSFSDIKLNNAKLMYFKTYMQDLGDFEKLYKKSQGRWFEFFKLAKTLEKSTDPEADLKKLTSEIN